MNINSFKIMTRKKRINDLDQISGKTEKATESSSKKMATKPAQKKIKKIEQANGKIDEAVKTSKELDKILGMRQKNPFKANTLEEFEESLKGKNLTDLREMCVAAGIFPSGNNTILRKKLSKGFDSFMKGGLASSLSQVPINESRIVPNSALQQEIDRIWSKK